MKVIFLVTGVVMALSQVAGQSCLSRQDRKQLSIVKQETRCYPPQPSLVQLPVPEGFDYVQPSVVKVKLCTGLACTTFPHRCLPTAGSITKRVYKVLLKKMDRLEAECTQMEVEEHHACECRSDPSGCPPNKVFNEDAGGWSVPMGEGSAAKRTDGQSTQLLQ